MMGVASLVLGIISIVLSFVPFTQLFASLLGVIGIVLGAFGRKQAVDSGLPTGVPTAGLVCSIIGLCLTLLMYVACAGALNAAKSAFS